MSGRRTSGSSRPSLGVQVLAVFSFISKGKSQFKRCLGKRLEVPDILLPDVHGLLTEIEGDNSKENGQISLGPKNAEP